jgi:hypothetical protein
MQLSSNLTQPLAVVAANSATLTSRTSQPFPIQAQQMSNWCWAALTASLCDYYTTPGPYNQQQVVALVINLPICGAGPLNPFCNQTCDIATALSTVGHLNGNAIDGTIQPGAMQQALQQYGPVACEMSIPNIGGHAVAVVNAYPGPSNKLYVDVADPSDGTIQTMSFDNFSSDYRATGGSWARTYLTS